jgi:hypothetical protein
MCNIQQIWLRILKYALVKRFTPWKHIFKEPPKCRKFLPFQPRKAAINATLAACAKQIISLFPRVLKVGLQAHDWMCFSLWPIFGTQDLTLRTFDLFLKCEHSELSTYILNTERLPCATHNQNWSVLVCIWSVWVSDQK